MNVHPNLGSSGADPPLAPEDWSMTIEHEGSGVARLHTATIERNGVHICRISMGCIPGGDEGAHSTLAIRARAWIADYLTRDHTGETVFSPLKE